MTYLEQLLEHKKAADTIALLGLGVEMRSFLEWLINTIEYPVQSIFIADTREELSLGDNISIEEKEVLQNQAFTGYKYLRVLDEAEPALVFKSPGMWSLKPELVEYRKKHGNKTIHSSLIYFIEKYREHIIGITGTKGKTTTSTLSNHLINSLAQKNPKLTSVYCGNTSNVSPYTFWSEKNADSSRFVIELSSYQLQDLGFAEVSPHISIITNLLIDHQDQHASPEEYWHAKEHIFLHQKTTDFGYISDQVLSKVPDYSKSIISVDDSLSLSSLLKSPLKGDHNAMNLSLGLHAVHSLIQPNTTFDNFIEEYKSEILAALSSYKQPPLRQELVRKVELDSGHVVQFINDGAGTEATSVAAAIKAYSDDQEWVWLFMNGRDKGSDTSILKATLEEKREKIIKKSVSGAVGRRIVHEGMADEAHPTLKHTMLDNISFAEVLSTWKSDHPEKGNTLNIVFSPGGSSFDEYKNYIERAKYWTEWAQFLDIS